MEMKKNIGNGKYVEISFLWEGAYYIGTNEKGGDYYLNTQYILFNDWDYAGERFSYRIDLKGCRIDKKTGNLVSTKDHNSLIYISYFKDGKETPEKGYITWKQLKSIKNGTNNLKPLWASKQYKEVAYDKKQQETEE